MSLSTTVNKIIPPSFLLISSSHNTYRTLSAIDQTSQVRITRTLSCTSCLSACTTGITSLLLNRPREASFWALTEAYCLIDPGQSEDRAPIWFNTLPSPLYNSYFFERGVPQPFCMGRCQPRDSSCTDLISFWKMALSFAENKIFFFAFFSNSVLFCLQAFILPSKTKMSIFFSTPKSN